MTYCDISDGGKINDKGESLLTQMSNICEKFSHPENRLQVL